MALRRGDDGRNQGAGKMSSFIADNPVQARAKNDLTRLRESCEQGLPSTMLMDRLLRWHSRRDYSHDDVSFLEAFLASSNPPLVRRKALEVLVRFGGSVSDHVELVDQSDRGFREFAMRTAAKYGDPDSVLLLATPEVTSLAVMLLRGMGKSEYLTSFMFSDNESVVSLAGKAMGGGLA